MDKNNQKKWSEKTPQEKKRAKINLALLSILALIIIGVGIATCNSEENQEVTPKEVVCNDELDGSVRQVKEYLKDNLNDPSSYDAVEWSPVVQQPETKDFSVRHKYRAKNALGATTLYNQMFIMDSIGNVKSVQDCD